MIFFLLDGCRKDVLDHYISQGLLPNIEYLQNRGTSVENAITVFPSTTGPTYAPFLMGLFPVKSGLPGIRWYDRIKRKYRVYCGTDAMVVNKDINKNFPTIYEHLPGKDTVAIMGMIDRGVARSVTPKVKMLWWYLKKGILEKVNRYNEDILGLDRILLQDFIKKLKKKDAISQFTFIGFHALDGTGHKEGSGKSKYNKTLLAMDDAIGELITELKMEGLFHSINLVISADHGSHFTDKNFDYKPYLEKYGLRVQDSVPRNTIFFNFKTRKMEKQNDMILAVSGNACVQIYIKKPGEESFLKRPTFNELMKYQKKDGDFCNLIEIVNNAPATRFTLAKELPATYHIFSKEGHSIINRDGLSFSYSVLEGKDPLEYDGVKLSNGSHYSKDDWLTATANLKFPDAVVQISQLLDANEAGDIIFTSAPGYEPWTEGQKGVHGGLVREDMRVPLIFSGPDFKREKIFCARTVDAFPTILTTFGKTANRGIDGKSLQIFQKHSKQAMNRKQVVSVGKFLQKHIQEINKVVTTLETKRHRVFFLNFWEKAKLTRVINRFKSQAISSWIILKSFRQPRYLYNVKEQFQKICSFYIFKLKNSKSKIEKKAALLLLKNLALSAVKSSGQEIKYLFDAQTLISMANRLKDSGETMLANELLERATAAFPEIARQKEAIQSALSSKEETFAADFVAEDGNDFSAQTSKESLTKDGFNRLLQLKDAYQKSLKTGEWQGRKSREWFEQYQELRQRYSGK
ncbi:alkaline phosphatase family protein [Candidatus Riflebacteria bacterium]